MSLNVLVVHTKGIIVVSCLWGKSAAPYRLSGSLGLGLWRIVTPLALSCLFRSPNLRMIRHPFFPIRRLLQHRVLRTKLFDLPPILFLLPLADLGLGTDLPGGLLQAAVALLIRAAGTETDADKGGPRPPLEDEDGEDDTEAETEGGLDEEVGEAAVPLAIDTFVSKPTQRR